MAKNYEYIEVDINQLLLDAENPRFASSSLVRNSSKEISQQAIIDHLMKHALITQLATRINETHELHGSELITCYKHGEFFIVVEGNRRICACKLLLDRRLIPETQRSNYPFVNENTKENIEKILVNVYPDRESIQVYLSDRHISGVKKWSALEKNNYYMNLFNQYKNVNVVSNYTHDTSTVVSNCIRKYQFFMDVFNSLRNDHPALEIENIDYLPLVDRFMDTLVGKDPQVGLNLLFDHKSMRYLCQPGKEDLYIDILKLVGEAFLIRNERKNCSEGELSKIISTELFGLYNQKQLILSDKRIPGLLKLIDDYKDKSSHQSANETSEGNSSENKSHDEKNNSPNKEADNGYGNNDKDENGGPDKSKDIDDEGMSDDNTYHPQVKYSPKIVKKDTLCFSTEEAKNFKIDGDSDYEIKCRSVLRDLSEFSVYKHPYTCALLYRTILEISTRMVYSRHAQKVKKGFDESHLCENLIYLNNNVLYSNMNTKDVPKIREAVKTQLQSLGVINVLNLYIHYSNPVDETIIISSWNTMKQYIKACLEL